MSLPLKISTVALEQITEIQRYYERNSVGASVQFRDALEHCLRIILQFLLGAQVRLNIYRSAPIEEFGYHII